METMICLVWWMVAVGTVVAYIVPYVTKALNFVATAVKVDMLRN